MRTHIMKKPLLPILLGVLFVAGSTACINKQSDSATQSTAQGAAAYTASGPSGLTYLTPSSVNITAVIAAVPSAGSDTDKVDNGVLHLLQSSRSSDECARAKTEVPVNLESFMGPAYGPLTADEVAQLNALFTVLVPEAKYFSGAAKKIWNRPRPYDEDSTLTPCVDKENTGAYPSGHATVSRVYAQILKVVYPDRAAAFMARADQIALDRVLGGVHHPSDVLAGQKLADAIAAALMQNANFKSALAAAVPGANIP